MNDTLRSMFTCLSKGDKVFLPSKFWEGLNTKNVQQLEAKGIDNFKQTVALNYFTWMINYKDAQFLYLLKNTKLSSWLVILNGLLTYRHTSLLTQRQQIKLIVFTKMLWKFVERIDTEGLLKILSEPRTGKPFEIFMDGKLISQDLANSVMEYYSICEHFRVSKTEKVTICELGAGYGRNAYIFLNTFPNSKYIIIDIPPALYISQQYLSSIFPNKRIFNFRSFENFKEVERQFLDSDIIFLLPHQAKMLPEKSVDLFINISSLHEMKMAQIHEYFKLIDKLTRKFFYTKQWLVSKNSADGIVITQNDYPVPANWSELYLRKAKVQTYFFEAMYSISQ